MFDNIRNRVQSGESSNPLLKSAQREASTTLESGLDLSVAREGTMTVSGAINKTLILTFLMLLTSSFSYSNPSSLLMWTGIIGGLVMVVIASMKPNTARWAAPAYALFEGLFVGAISAIYAARFNGIVLQAVSLTIALLLAMLFLYQAGIIKVTAKFRAGVLMATGAVALMYLVSIGLSFFGMQLPFLHQGGIMGIGISCVIIAIASMNLLIDFDNFEKGADQGMAKKYEWVFAMGLLVTLVWIYIELLRLLSQLSRD